MSSFSKNELLFCIILFLHVMGSDIMVATSVSITTQTLKKLFSWLHFFFMGEGGLQLSPITQSHNHTHIYKKDLLF